MWWFRTLEAPAAWSFKLDALCEFPGRFQASSHGVREENGEEHPIEARFRYNSGTWLSQVERLPFVALCPIPAMVRSRGKSRSRTPTQTTPPPTPIPKPPPDSSIRKKLSALRRGNAKTSSIVATSSIGSSSLDPLPATYSSHLDRNAIGQESGSHRAAESAWKTAYSTARMVIGFAKESSDMFLPLKAVVGALSVLIMNYDVSPVLVIRTNILTVRALANRE